MRFDRSSESYRSRALQAERIAETYALSGDGQWARVWRAIADDLRATANRLVGRPVAEMAVVR